jgi:putative protein-disulfide isomerase
MVVLHYIYDPFCGWCYGAAPLVAAASEVAGLELRLHAGGMMMGANRQPVTPQLRSFVMHHDQRITQMSGQPFGKAYQDGLLCDPKAVFDSEPPTMGILAAEQFGKGYAMLQRIQQAHFIEGQRVAELPVLTKLAEEIGIDPVAFQAAFEQLSVSGTVEHIAHSRDLLGRAGGMGFPTFVLEKNGHQTRIDHGPYLGRTADFLAKLKSALD